MSARILVRKLVAVIVASAVALAAPLSYAGDLNAEVNTMFNNLGAIGNYTAPGAFKGQTFNTYTGGNLYLRSPNKTYQLAAIQFPTAKGGCGGIDLFAGSFSYINKEQFVALLRNIGNNAIGAAFNLALCSMSPDLCDLLKYLQDQVAKMNQLNVNSCQAAEGIVAAAGSLLTDRTQEKEGKTAGANLNLFGDVFEARGGTAVLG